MWRKTCRVMPPRGQRWQAIPGDLDLIAMPLVLPWYPDKDERIAASLFCLRDVNRLEAVSKALRRAVKYHEVSFKACPLLVKMELALVKITLVRVLWAKGIRNNPKLARIAGELEQYYRQMTTERDLEDLELQEDVTWAEYNKKRTGISKRSRRPSD